jgi:SAM-dependent methyltransferase
MTGFFARSHIRESEAISWRSMENGSPATTRAIFEHVRVAEGYASARPYLHPEVFERVRALVRPNGSFGCALDVGCGTGLSSVALRALAGRVVGIDTSLAMLRSARAAAGVRYVAAEAEQLPFSAGRFDLLVACGSIDWVDRGRFLPGAAAVLAAGGWLVSLDFGDTGRSPDVPGLAAWYDEVFQRACPRPPTPDPLITAGEAARHGFDEPVHLGFSTHCAMMAPQYADFLLTESNVIAAVEYGRRNEADVHQWLLSELRLLFGDQARRTTFGGYVQAMRKRAG